MDNKQYKYLIYFIEKSNISSNFHSKTGVKTIDLEKTLGQIQTIGVIILCGCLVVVLIAGFSKLNLF